MTPIQKRFFLFLAGCIPARLGLAFAARASGTGILRTALVVLFSVISIGFLTIFALGLRKTGAETMGEEIWWDILRPVHATLYGMAAVTLAFGQNSASSSLILADTAIGLGSFFLHHSGNFL